MKRFLPFLLLFTSLALAQTKRVFIPMGGASVQTADYTALSGDAGKLIVMNASSATLMLPSVPPFPSWAIFVTNINATTLTISGNGKQIDGSSSNLSLTTNQGAWITTDGSNYFTQRGGGSGGGGGGLADPGSNGIVTRTGVNVTGVAANADINTAAGFTVADDASTAHNVGDETWAGNKTFTGSTTTQDLAIGGQLSFTNSTINMNSGWPASSLVGCTNPVGATHCASLGVDSDGVWKASKDGSAPASLGGATSFADGSLGAPGWASTNHPELGLAIVTSQIIYSVTQCVGNGTTATLTISTSDRALNWPTTPAAATFSISGLTAPCDVFNGNHTLSAISGGTPTSTISFLDSHTVTTTANSGNAQIYEVAFTGYAQSFGRIETNSANPAHHGSIRFAKTDDLVRRNAANTADTVMIQGKLDDTVQVGDAAGVTLVGPLHGAVPPPVLLTDLAPAVGDDGLIVALDPQVATHITKVSCGVSGTTSVVINLVNGANSLIADTTCTAGSVNTVNVTTFANGAGQCGGTSSCAVAADAPVVLHIGTITGSPTALNVRIETSID